MEEISAIDFLTKEQCIEILNKTGYTWEEDTERKPGYLYIKFTYEDEDGDVQREFVGNYSYSDGRKLDEIVTYRRAAEHAIQWYNDYGGE